MSSSVSAGRDVGEGPDLPGDLRLLGRAAPAGACHAGPGHLLGLHEGQSAPPELHIEPPASTLHHLLHLWLTLLSLSKSPGRRQDGFNRKKLKKNHQKQYLFKCVSRMKIFFFLFSFSFLSFF